MKLLFHAANDAASVLGRLRHVLFRKPSLADAVRRYIRCSGRSAPQGGPSHDPAMCRTTSRAVMR